MTEVVKFSPMSLRLAGRLLWDPWVYELIRRVEGGEDADTAIPLIAGVLTGCCLGGRISQTVWKILMEELIELARVHLDEDRYQAIAGMLKAAMDKNWE